MTLRACYCSSVTWNKQRTKPLTLLFHCLNLSLQPLFFSLHFSHLTIFSPCATYLPDLWLNSFHIYISCVKKQRRQKGPLIGLAGGLFWGLLYVQLHFLLSALKQTVSRSPLMGHPPLALIVFWQREMKRGMAEWKEARWVFRQWLAVLKGH